MNPLKTASLILTILFYSCSTLASPHHLDALVQAEDDRNPEAIAIKNALKSKNPTLRARGAMALGRIMKPVAINSLFGLLNDRNPSVRLEAIFALGQFGWVAGASIGREVEIANRLATLLHDGNSKVRQATAEALGKIGLELTPKLITPALVDPQSGVRAEAIIALGRSRVAIRARNPKKDPEDLPLDLVHELIKLKKDADPQVRRALGFVIVRTKDKRLLELAIALSEDPDTQTRFFALSSLDKLAEASALPRLLIASQKDSDLANRVTAISAVGNLRAGEQLSPTLAKDNSFQIRSALATAVGLSEKADITIIYNLQNDTSAWVRASALAALVNRKKAGSVELLNTALTDPSWIIREAAVTASSHLGPAQEGFLHKILQGPTKDPDVRVRAAALEALAGIATKGAFQDLLDALESPELSERGSAAGALSSRKEPSRMEAASKAYQASSGDKWVELRESLVEVFESLTDEKSTSQLRLIAMDPSESVANKARTVLKARGITDLPAPPVYSQSHSPFRKLTFSHNPKITLETTRGKIRIECFAKEAPIHVANFVGFIRQGLYNGLPWHRVVPGFVIQGGDPDKTGWGGAGFMLRAEINHRRFSRGTLGMPRAQGFDTGGVQIFITHVPTPHLDGQYTVFGQVIEGLDVIDRIEKGDVIHRATIN